MNVRGLKAGIKLSGAFGISVLFFLLTGAYNLIQMSSLAGLTEKATGIDQINQTIANAKELQELLARFNVNG